MARSSRPSTPSRSAATAPAGTCRGLRAAPPATPACRSRSRCSCSPSAVLGRQRDAARVAEGFNLTRATALVPGRGRHSAALVETPPDAAPARAGPGRRGARAASGARTRSCARAGRTPTRCARAGVPSRPVGARRRGWSRRRRRARPTRSARGGAHREVGRRRLGDVAAGAAWSERREPDTCGTTRPWAAGRLGRRDTAMWFSVCGCTGWHWREASLDLLADRPVRCDLDHASTAMAAYGFVPVARRSASTRCWPSAASSRLVRARPRP